MSLIVDLKRRAIVLGAAATLAAPFLNVHAHGAFTGVDGSVEPSGFWERPRWVWLKRAASGEVIKIVYWQNGQLIDDAYRQLSWFLRDLRFESMLKRRDPAISFALNRGIISEAHLSPWVLMDPVLLDILYAYCAWLHVYGVESPILMTSAFRHLITNNMTEGSARNSEHVKGGAGDIVVPGVSPIALAKFGKWLSGGGVGLYTNRGFIHVDRGRVRSWSGR